MSLTLEDALMIVKQLVPNGKLTHIQEMVFRGSWLGKTYEQIAIEAGYNRGHVKNSGGQLWSLLSTVFGEKVTKGNLPGAFCRYLLKQDRHPDRSITAAVDPGRIDWGETILGPRNSAKDITVFYGRATELNLLANWLQTEQCRLVAICGMAGIGKTTLAVKLTEIVAPTFDRAIWISLRDVPPIPELVNEIVHRLSPVDRSMKVGEDVTQKISNLIQLLSRGRYLVVLDNFDAVLAADSTTDRPNYYLELLKSAGELNHQSCVLVTTREKPATLAALAGEKLPVRTLDLSGLELTAAGELLRAKGLKAEPLYDRLIDNYSG